MALYSFSIPRCRYGYRMSRAKHPHRRRVAPLPIRDGLNASRVRSPEGGATALELITAAVMGQRHRHPDDDEQAINERFRLGEVVDRLSRPISPDQFLTAGTDVWFHRIPAPEPTLAGPMPVIFEDEDLVVVDKPAFLATIPRGRHITETAVVRLRRERNEPDLVPAHRLDRLTSGVLLFLRRPEIRGAYQTLFTQPGAITKRYEALAPLPHTPIAPGTVLRTRQEKIRGIMQASTIDGEPNAVTIVDEIVPVTKNTLPDVPLHTTNPHERPLALWKLRPLTGRTHQLRLHLFDLGCPIVDDPAYPVLLPEDADDPTRPMRLLCREMSFTDPWGQPRSFASRRAMHALS